MKKYLFNQPAGFGDILLIMSIAEKYAKEGHTIIWPTAVHYHNHQKNFPYVKFWPQEKFGLYDAYDSKRDGIYEDNTYKVFPFRWADVIFNNGRSNLKTCMWDKYKLVDLPWEDWRNFTIVRDYEKEDELFKELGLKEGDEYNVINENQTRIFQKTEIKVDNGLRNIYMNLDPKYNMLDWLKVWYNATTIHTVATASLVLIDKLDDLQPKERHIYKRIWDNDHSSYDYYMNKEYIWH